MKSSKAKQGVFISEAAFEYFIAIMITGAFLTTILNQAGVPDAVSGILSSLAVLSYSAQVVSAALNKTKNKYLSAVSLLTIANELIFALLYLVPFFKIPSHIKTVILVTMLLCGQLILNFVKPSKYNWISSQIPPEQLGTFTAKKESVSLLGGMLFSLVMSKVIDHFEETGRIREGFLICCFVMIVLSAIHISTIIMCKTPESTTLNVKTESALKSVKTMFSDTNFRKLVVMDALWHVSSGVTSFNGVYQKNTLGFSLTFISIITMIASISRVLMSFPLGKLADKTSWANMTKVAFSIAAVSFLMYSLSNPSNGKIMFTLFLMLHYAAMAGINGAMTNITFDYIPYEKRTTAIGIKFAVGGVVGFLASLAGSVVVDFVQKKGNKLFGMTVYPQQILSFAVMLICIINVIYVFKVIDKLKVSNRKTSKV